MERFGAYCKAVELFDLVVLDLSKHSSDFTLTRLIAQQYASADSIAANIEEGYGRGSRKEYTQFLLIARVPHTKPWAATSVLNTGFQKA